MMIGIDRRPAGFNGELNYVCQIDYFLLQINLAAGDARNVKQVVDHTRHVFDLVLDYFQGPLKAGSVGSFELHDLNGVTDGRERIAELMGEHGKKLVLAQVRVFEGLDGALKFSD